MAAEGRHSGITRVPSDEKDLYSTAEKEGRKERFSHLSPCIPLTSRLATLTPHT